MKTSLNTLNSLFFRLLFSLCLSVGISLSAAEDDHADHSNETEPHAEKTHDEHAGHDHEEKPDAHGEDNEHAEEEKDEHEGEEEDEHGGPIRLAERDLKDFGIEVAVAGPGMIHEEIRVPGEIRMNENATAHVSPRFEGMVKKIHHRLGETVKAGDVLAEVESHETFQIFQLKAPINGTIVDFHLTLGENVGPENYAYVIADTSTVWADLGVYQRDLHKVAPAQKVSLSTTHDHSAVKGVVAYVGPTVDEATRTGLARVVLDNPSGHLRPGSFVVGEISLNETEGEVVIPRAALHTLEDQTVVFVETEEEGGGFEPRPVQIGRSDSQYVEITKGLDAGSRYVSKGGFFLKADSQKEDFGDGHGH